MFIVGIIALALGLGLAIFYAVQVVGLRNDEKRRKENQWHNGDFHIRASKDEVSEDEWSQIVTDLTAGEISRAAKLFTASATASSAYYVPKTPAPAPVEPEKKHGYQILTRNEWNDLPKRDIADTLAGACKTQFGYWVYSHYNRAGNKIDRTEPLTDNYRKVMEKRRAKLPDPDDMFSGPEWEDERVKPGEL
jgi:hypothetical protein